MSKNKSESEPKADPKSDLVTPSTADPVPEGEPIREHEPKREHDPKREHGHGHGPKQDRDRETAHADTLPAGLSQEEFDALPPGTRQELALGAETVEQARKREEDRLKAEGDPRAEYDREGNLVKPVQGAPDVYDRDYDLQGKLNTGGPLPRFDDPIYDRAGRPQSGSTLPPDDKSPHPYVADKLGDPTRNYTGEDTLHPSPGREDTLKGYREREQLAEREGRPVPSEAEEEWQTRYKREQKVDRQAGRIPQAQTSKALPPDDKSPKPYVADELGDPSRNYEGGKPTVNPPKVPDSKIWGKDDRDEG